jgi:hypothetical protein
MLPLLLICVRRHVTAMTAKRPSDKRGSEAMHRTSITFQLFFNLQVAKTKWVIFSISDRPEFGQAGGTMKPPSGCHCAFVCYSRICGILPCSLLACNYAVSARDAIPRKKCSHPEPETGLPFFGESRSFDFLPSLYAEESKVGERVTTLITVSAKVHKDFCNLW